MKTKCELILSLFQELLDRLVIINTAKADNKIHFLFNVEQSMMLGLNLLNSLAACLDTLLLLDSQFKVMQVLVASQCAEDVNSESVHHTVIFLYFDIES